ncbi:MAG: pantothenate kinase [Candidatus Omnitrophica bacterium CG11_big_fil_rev_8_21_14_0_20_63_9]|nr:MAG: pantothenate kinase [Candidatus Omnitrophica bacterium CG11_big_fil_rev_8_21_14_0_20_63_9]
MILAIDIGNTTTSFGVFEGAKLKSQFSVATQPWRTADEITLQLKALATTKHLHLTKAKQILICSVVPRMTSVLTEALRTLDAIPIRLIGQDVNVPLKNRYTYPEQVGQDRLVGAYAAWKTYKMDCIVADFGTAITIDVVNKKGEYLGGIIAPGLEISLEALASRTALLPKVELKEPPELLGRDTANSIRSGVLHGCVALCDGLVTQLKHRYAPQAVVVATGGASPLIAKLASTINHLKPQLVLEGLQLLSEVKL